jgi:pimeloyl-ACP methyl ester carboxylesterase
MERTTVNGVRLAYEVHGEGDPMLVIHGGFWADVLRPLAGEAVLAGYRRILYHRRGYGGSSGPAGGFESQVADAVALLDHLEIDAAHVVGHSEGAMIGLSLAAEHPERVRSLSLLEPLPPIGWMAANGLTDGLEMLGAALAEALGRYQAGEPEGAVNAIFSATIPDWREAVEAAWPGGVEQGNKDSATMFETEFPALGSWQVGPEQAAAIDCPVLSWQADPANPLASAGRAFLHELFSQCEDADLEDATHFAPLTEPGAVAEAVAAFVARHSTPAVLA